MHTTNENKQYLMKKFYQWFRRVGAQGDWKELFKEIEKEYQEPERYYHTFYGHIAFCIRELYKMPEKNMIENINTIELSLMLHDSKMSFGAKDNEERSAEFALDICRRMGLPEKFASCSAMYIRHTDHIGLPFHRDSQFGIDIDLAILGQDEKIFDEYERNIRQEYYFVQDDVFKRERAKVLKYFLNRPQSLFLTEYFSKKYEKQARKNIMRSIEKLEQ